MPIYYAGIGSRKTPSEVLEMMQKIGFLLAKKGFVLRSGAADGADLAFERGCDKAKGKKEIFLPFKGFNGSNSQLFDCSQEAIDIALKYHPAPDKLGNFIQIMARNSFQVLGHDLKTPSSFVVCYTNDGKASGGTGQAIRIAEDCDIPVFNLFNKENLQNLKNFLRTLGV